ncbi:MAG: DUF4922 domain-containing protein [Tannerellaceae bacterium]|jgi:hypothetical protein|nr:DUF4922 domain-containing protein [Tannerellaceae bacterium]
MKRRTPTSSSKLLDLLQRQLQVWPLLEKNYGAMAGMQVKKHTVGGFTVKVQYNPARSVSSCAKMDSHSLQQRPCFLCSENLPPQQEALLWGRYLLLCNPYPIFPQHFTLAWYKHIPQSFFYIDDMLALARRLEGLTLFYNGPKSGASAPDHLHFQAVTRSYMPADNEWDRCRLTPVYERNGGAIYMLAGYIRNGFIIKARGLAMAGSLFMDTCFALPKKEDELEPMMNVFCRYRDDEWRIVVIPRKAYRPRQFFADDDTRLLCSPGAADIGGVFVTSREKDFHAINSYTLRDIYKQICYDDEAIAGMANKINQVYQKGK